MVSLRMTRNLVRTGLLALGMSTTVILPATLSAQSQSMAAHYSQNSKQTGQIPSVLSSEEREHYREVFRAIEREQWDEVEELIEQRKDGLLYQTALAEYYTHANSPKIDAERIAAWFKLGVHLPQAEQLSRMGATRGLATLPELPREQSFRGQPYAPKRILPRSIVDGTIS